MKVDLSAFQCHENIVPQKCAVPFLFPATLINLLASPSHIEVVNDNSERSFFFARGQCRQCDIKRPPLRSSGCPVSACHTTASGPAPDSYPP